MSMVILSSTSKDMEMKNRSKPTVLFVCSGRSNVGKITQIAADILSFHGPNLFRTVPAREGAEGLRDAERDGELIFVVEGCDEHCAKKKLDLAGIEPDFKVVLTEIGIEKTMPTDLKSEYLGRVVSELNKASRSMRR